MRSYRTLVFWQASAYAAEDGVLTETMVDDIVSDALRAHEKKVLWQQDHEAGDYLTPLRSSKATRVSGCPGTVFHEPSKRAAS